MAEVNSSGSSRRLTPFERRDLQRALAAKEETRSAIARRFHVSPSYVTQFAKRYALEIDTIKADLDNAFAGLWSVSKVHRVMALEQEYALLLNSDKKDHHEWAKARMQAIHQIAEEMGDLPPRATVTVVPVEHVIVGVDLDALK